MKENSDSNIVISPRRNKNEKEIPTEGIFFVNPTEAATEMGAVKKKGAESRFLFNSNLHILNENKFIAGPAIGAPMAALTMEKLIALGAKRIILFGWCGAIAKELHVGDVVVPQLAMSGEGTSAYYTSQDQQVGPDKELREQIVTMLSANTVKTHSGCVWSTDAVYREKRSYLATLQKENGVSAVDMEFSALCSVAHFRDVKFAAVLVVSDEIWGASWRPGFSNKNFKKNTALVRQLLINNHIGPQEK